MKDYDYFEEVLEEVVKHYIALKFCLLHGITSRGELEIEEPTGYTLMVNTNSSTLFRYDQEINISDSSFNTKELEFLQYLSMRYKNLNETRVFAEKQLAELQYSFNLYKKQVKG